MKGILSIVTAALLGACGVVGAPVAPETIGIAPVIERQKLKQGPSRPPQAEEAANAETDHTDPMPQGQDEELLPLRPVGTR